MKVCGIVAEYNPFHNGHKYHITQTKNALDIDCFVAVMSGNTAQRGEIAIFDMYDRAETAVLNGIDLVLSIPPQFVLSSAEFYAFNAVYILNSLGCIDYLSFGSECGVLQLLKNELEKASKSDIKEKMKAGVTYARAASDSDILKEPNNILGVEYIKAIKKLDSDISPFTVKRNKVKHDDINFSESFASAGFIRNLMINSQNYDAFVPDNFVKPKNDRIFSEKNVGQLLAYRLSLGDKDNFQEHANISEGLNNRIIKYMNNSATIEELVKNIKCKRYTETRIRRALYSILFDIKKSDIFSEPPSYTRVLAISDKGRELLNKIRKTRKIDIYSRVTKKDIQNNSQLEKELRINRMINSFT